MNAKLLKFYQTFAELAASDLKDKTTLEKLMQTFITLDFAQATDVWEYILLTNETALAKDDALAKIIAADLINFFYNKNASKTVKAINENANIRRLVFTFADNAMQESGFTLLLDMIVGNKADNAEEIFKCLIKNERIQFGKDFMFLLERAFIEIMKKSATKKVEISRKMSDFLLRFASKIKTEEKAIVEQRIKEVL